MAPRSYAVLPLIFAAALVVGSAGPALAQAGGCGTQRVLVFDQATRLYICVDKSAGVPGENVRTRLLRRQQEQRVRRLQATQRARVIQQGSIGRQLLTTQRKIQQRENLRRLRPASDNEVKLRVQATLQRQASDSERRFRAGREAVQLRELTDRLQEQTLPQGELRRDQLRNSEQAREQRSVR
ncbi:MAG: hypothetical protein QF654_01665 [Alphaproteobacteria bacterium]|jgi:hypothetical protein|nr:hypothetical protein [Alphaproteobacteria bacterium]